MKRNILWILAGALVCLVAACDKNGLQDEPRVPDTMVTYIKAGNDEGTKGSVNNTTAAFTWNTGDTIAVHTTAGYILSKPLESTYDATTDATFVLEGVGESTRDHFAFFPASLVHGSLDGIKPNCAGNHTADNLTVRLRGSYTLNEVQGEVSPTPMIAANAPNGGLAFKALCPLLRVTLVNIPKQTRRIEFNFNGRKVQGEFTLTGVTPGSTAIETTAAEGTEDIISVSTPDISAWQDQLVVNLPVPAGSYDNMTVTAYDAESGGHVLLMLTQPIKAGGWTPTRKASRKMTAILPVFSLGPSTKVAFSPGNLRATFKKNTSTAGWVRYLSFAPYQYDYAEAAIYEGNVANSKIASSLIISSSLTGWHELNWIVDLFGWSTDAVVGIKNSENDNDYHGGFVDWGFYSIEDKVGYYEPNIWRTPTGGPEGEWKYLLNTRTVSNTLSDGARYVMVTIPNVTRSNGFDTRKEDILGMVVFPDNYTHPADVTIGGTPKYNGPSTYAAIISSISDWEKMEAAGAVFLPLAGYRSGNTVIKNYYQMYYWSSTEKTADTGYGLSAYGGDVDPQASIRKHIGCSVRLVRDLK